MKISIGTNIRKGPWVVEPFCNQFKNYLESNGFEVIENHLSHNDIDI